jgi:hypothetical protein
MNFSFLFSVWYVAVFRFSNKNKSSPLLLLPCLFRAWEVLEGRERKGKRGGKGKVRGREEEGSRRGEGKGEMGKTGRGDVDRESTEYVS